MGEKTHYFIATSRALENAFLALRDVVSAVQDEEYVLIGGLMVMLLAVKYPVQSLIPRATQDADIGVPTIVAKSGAVHDSLVKLNYAPVRGNAYVMEGEDGREVNILLPSHEHAGKGSSVVVGERGFDAAPGLHLALSASPEPFDVNITLLDNSQLTFTVMVPSLLGALVLKLCVREHRREERDLYDIHQLLRIRKEYDHEFTEWSLASPQRGERGDAQKAAQAIMKLKKNSYTNIVELRMLLQKYVAKPKFMEPL
ncbi:nucleotidyl transferase AbiEii/AbiGii toxin family protein [Timonella sp. A28]|uniref:nucleotidyl transferase AbiEii/AbiGii toxin family protein n=1 Tax=Timonella sp. A28 TaxID=3442640 RepID=UPI003EBAFB60